ncbi:MAG: 5'-methylthioadenosine/S-adenosylhomocysteine nucleosidase [Oscillospiraceae bacterium]
MRLGLVYAMPIELAGMLERTHGRELETVAGVHFYELEEDIIACAGGIGKVNIAMATQLLIDRYAPDCVLNAGVAGSLTPELEPGDLVLVTKFNQHDMDTSGIGDPVGFVSTVERVDFPTAHGEVSRRILRELGCEFSEGAVASGDWFATDCDRARWIRDTFHPLLCEMEGCAIAQVCCRSELPFISLKAVSDKIFHGDNGEEYQFNLPEACDKLSAVFLPFVRKLKEAL